MIRREWFAVLGLLAVSMVVFALTYLPMLPNASGQIAGDYTVFLPDLLAGYYWWLHNGLLAIPWFSPAQCGGVPFFPDPQVAFYSLPQLLALAFSPLAAVQATLLIFAALGFGGSYVLARVSFRASVPAALLAAVVFMFNGFFASRILIGHLTFHAFMLLPALAASVLPGATRPSWPGAILRAGIAGACLGVMVHAGMLHILPPVLLSVLILMVLHALLFGPRRLPAALLPAALLAGGGAAGLVLGAGKLAAALSFIASFPRTGYPLPGIASLWSDAAMAVTTLFFTVPDDAAQAVTNGLWTLDRHEWEYGVSPVPLGLMLVAAALWVVRHRRRVTRGQGVLLAALLLLLALPILVNWYQPGWNAVLKALPYFGNSSNLVRWFCAYILPASLGGALALDTLCASATPGSSGRATAAALAITAVFVWVVTRDLGYYAAGGYAPADIQAAYARAATTGAVPPIDAVIVLLDPAGHVVINAQRDDALTRGRSQLLCYQPIFGYRLENFPIPPLHPGPALDRSSGVLNFKNPACYVFPGENACRPGAQFDPAAEPQLRALLDYRPYPFAIPGYARAANAASALGLGAWLIAMLGAAGLLLRRR